LDTLQFSSRLHPKTNSSLCPLFRGKIKFNFLLEYGADHVSTLQNLKQIKTEEFDTSIGKIAIGGIGDDIHQNGPYAIIVDVGGDDYYKGSVAASDGVTKISVVLDLDRNDLYENSDPNKGSQGFGNGRLGILFDLNGSDTYKSISKSQGSGIKAGVGILWDKGGDDFYYSGELSQGFGGEVINTYNATNVPNSDREKGSGFGLLVDGGGADVFIAENLGTHSAQFPGKRISENWSQGAGYGRDGYGILIDLGEGDDIYVANLFAQGVAFCKGTGMLFDVEGSNFYYGKQYIQGAAAKGGIGIFFDLRGDDYYQALSSQGLGSARGPDLSGDPALAFFLDESGNDTYRFNGHSCGVGMNDAIGYFFDVEGDDTYTNVMGRSIFPQDGFFGQRLTMGFFCDLGGHDNYLNGNGCRKNDNACLTPNDADSKNSGVSPGGYRAGVFMDSLQ